MILTNNTTLASTEAIPIGPSLRTDERTWGAGYRLLDRVRFSGGRLCLTPYRIILIDMKNRLTQLMNWLYTLTGLLFGWLLVAVFLTGTLTLFDTEITSWMQPELQEITSDTSRIGGSCVFVGAADLATCTGDLDISSDNPLGHSSRTGYRRSGLWLALT